MSQVDERRPPQTSSTTPIPPQPQPQNTTQPTPPLPPNTVPTLSIPFASLPTPAFPPSQDHCVIPNLPSYIHINPSIHFFSIYSQLKRYVPLAIDRAIKEIISPVPILLFFFFFFFF